MADFELISNKRTKADIWRHFGLKKKKKKKKKTLLLRRRWRYAGCEMLQLNAREVERLI